MKVTKFYAQGGDTTKIFKNITVTNPQMVVVSQTNPPQIGDVEITEGQYDTYQAAIVAANETAERNTAQTFQANKVAQKAVAQPILLGLGIPQAAIDVMFL